MESSTWLILLDKALIPVLVAVLTPIILMFVKKAIDAFEAKTNLQVADSYRWQLDELVRKGIAYAEEQARKAAKTGATATGESKLADALDFIRTQAEAAGLDTKTDDLAKLIEAKLFDNRPEAPAEQAPEKPAE